MGFLSDMWDGMSGKTASRSATQGGTEHRAELQKGMDFLTERDSLGNQYGDQALTGLNNIYQGDMNAQQDLIDRSMASPLYQQMMLSKEDAGDQIMRNASATGGLRSGNVQSNMYRNDLRYDADALTTSYDDQLSGLSGLVGQRDRNTGAIAGLHSDMGMSYAQQRQAEGQAKTDGAGNIINTGAKIIGSFFSDPRLKESIKEIGAIHGHRIFRWKWNDEAKDFGLTGESTGVLAHLVNKYNPDAIGVSDGYLTVNYDALDLNIGVLNSLEA